MLIQLEQEFWDGVQSSTPPALDGSDASSEFLKQRFPDSISAKIELPKEAAALINQYDAACEKIAEYTEQKQEAENLLKQMLGEYEGGVVRGIYGVYGGGDGDSIADSDTNMGGGGADDASYGIGDRYITWKTVYQERLDTKAIKSDHPTLCQKYSNTTSCRRFCVKSVGAN